MKRSTFLTMTLLSAGVLALTGCKTTDQTMLKSAPATADGKIILKTAMIENEDAFAAGKAVAEKLMAQLGGVAPHAVLMMDCYDSVELKQQAIKGVSSVIDSKLIFGGAVYGVYTQEGATNMDGISLMALAGDGLEVQAALVTEMNASKVSMETQNELLKERLGAGGSAVVGQLTNPKESDLIILMGDAHSPKNQYLLDGVQTVVGKDVKVTGGSISKNDGLTYVYYRGEMYSDAAIAVSLKGGFKIGAAGRQAKTNNDVIATAAEGAKTAIDQLGNKKTYGLIAFDCAGRMGKLNELTDEVNAIKKVVGTETPIFGTYCAGEFGASDTKMGESGDMVGVGWHVMFSALGK